MKKTREMDQLRRVMELAGDFPSSVPKADESPDFLFPGNPRVGVELTDYVRGGAGATVTARTLEELHNRVANEANRVFTAKYDSPVCVHLSWGRPVDLSKRTASEYALQLVELVAPSVPTGPYESVRIDADTHPGASILEAIPAIHVLRMKQGMTGGWASIEAGFVSVSAAEVQAVLDKKEPLVTGYRCRCDTAWLIVAADGMRISSSADLRCDGHGFVTSFDRVYFYDGSSNTVSRLK